MDNKMQGRHGRAVTALHLDVCVNPMNLCRLTIALVLAVCIAAPARDQGSPQTAAALIHEVVVNELTDRAQLERTSPNPNGGSGCYNESPTTLLLPK